MEEALVLVGPSVVVEHVAMNFSDVAAVVEVSLDAGV